MTMTPAKMDAAVKMKTTQWLHHFSGINEILYLVPTSLYCYPCRKIENAILGFTIEF
uniref:Uncharacterized protein n=1 Tax=Solanum lycopersicum TaxID=4081 RepID=A0A3Q7IYS4_SOLLC